MEYPQDAPLKRGLHVNEDVTARDEVEPRERRVFADVVPGEDDELPHLPRDLIALVGPQEEAVQALRRDVELDVERVHGGPGAHEGVLVDVGREYLDLVGARAFAEILEQDDRQGIGLFAGGAAGDPHANGRRGAAALDDPRKKDGLEDLEWLRVAEERRYADEEIVVETPKLSGVGGEDREVVVDLLDPVKGHAPADTPLDRVRLVLLEVDPVRRAQLGEDPRRGAGAEDLGGLAPADVRVRAEAQ